MLQPHVALRDSSNFGTAEEVVQPMDDAAAHQAYVQSLVRRYAIHHMLEGRQMLCCPISNSYKAQLCLSLALSYMCCIWADSSDGSPTVPFLL